LGVAARIGRRREADHLRERAKEHTRPLAFLGAQAADAGEGKEEAIERAPRLFRPVGAFALCFQVRGVRFGLVLDPDERRRVTRQFEAVGDDQGNRLTAEFDLGVVKRAERRPEWREPVAVAAIRPGEARGVLVREDP
jgi:hypothetical protein